MTDSIRHRGPDDEGYVVFGHGDRKPVIMGGVDTPDACYKENLAYSPHISTTDIPDFAPQLLLGHRRLSILDLSSTGHQPMCSPDQRYWIVYNGEIYNYRELRQELEQYGFSFISQTDTEVILAAYQKWGSACLDHFNGMFSFLIYDHQKRRLFAARDRFGIKPLYYRVSSLGIAFASEIKQFTVFSDWQAKLNGQRAYDFLNWNIIDHTSETLFAGVFQLRGGEMLELDISQICDYHAQCIENKPLSVKRWYQLEAKQFLGDGAVAAEEFKELLMDSVGLRLRSDVPVGSCLSGGLDSSSIVCIINSILNDKNSSELQKTFSSCSEDERFDERKYIEHVTAKTQVDSHYAFPEADELFSHLYSLVWHQDEPFGSTSIYAQWGVFKLAAENNVKVMLDGQGADELLAGYKPYFASRYARLFKQGHWITLMREVQAAKQYYGNSQLQALQYIAYILLPDSLRQQLLQLSGREQLEPNWINLSRLNAQPINPFLKLGNKTDSIRALSYAQVTATNLPMLLHWEDRNSMAHSVEARVPFLDYRLVEFTLGLPDEFKLSAGITKRVLREAMVGLLPVDIQNRKDKMGFLTAEQEWMTKQCPAVFKKYVEEAIAATAGILTNNAHEQANAVIDNKKPFSYLPWRVISFGNWVKRFNVVLS